MPAPRTFVRLTRKIMLDKSAQMVYNKHNIS